MNLKKIVTLGITAAIAASTIAVTALTSVNGFDKPYKPGYSYAYTGNSYTRMDYSEKGNFVMTRAKNKKSTKLYPKLFVIVRDYKLDEVDSSKEYRELAKKDDDASIGVIGCYNYRSTNGHNYVHKIVVYTDKNHSNKVSTIKKTVG